MRTDAFIGLPLLNPDRTRCYFQCVRSLQMVCDCTCGASEAHIRSVFDRRKLERKIRK